MLEMRCYFDNAATTKVSQAVLDEMLPCFSSDYGNPSASGKTGRDAARILYTARSRIAEAIRCDSREVIFTSGGTESDALALWGVVLGAFSGKKHIISTRIEHKAVLATLERMAAFGLADVTCLAPDKNGIVSVDDFIHAIRPETILASVMYANNETGMIQPVSEIGKICREHGILFHTDAVQAVGHIPVDVLSDNIDLMSISAHKMHGPKGIGALYVRNGIRLQPILAGGNQERGLRPGTENIPAIAGFGKAIQEAVARMPDTVGKVRLKRDRIIDVLTGTVPGTALNGARDHRLPSNVNVSFEGVSGQQLLMMLDMAGIEVSLGSACAAGSPEPSHVLESMGIPADRVRSSLRITLSGYTTDEEVDRLLAVLPVLVEKLRA